MNKKYKKLRKLIKKKIKFQRKILNLKRDMNMNHVKLVPIVDAYSDYNNLIGENINGKET